jgi:hypothetical protein
MGMNFLEYLRQQGTKYVFSSLQDTLVTAWQLIPNLATLPQFPSKEECSNSTCHGSDSGEENQNYIKINSNTTFPSESGEEYALIPPIIDLQFSLFFLCKLEFLPSIFRHLRSCGNTLPHP